MAPADRHHRGETMHRGLLTVLAFGLLACATPFGGGGSPSAAASPPTGLQQILARGELRVATSADLPPLTWRDKSGELAGFEIDLIRALADAMRLETRFVERPFPDLLATLENGEADLVIAGMTMTPERNARVAFAGPYFVSGTAIVSASDAIAGAESAADLDDPDLRYAVLSGSTSVEFVAREMPQAKVVETRDYEASIALLLAGEVDGVVADFLACQVAVWRHPEAGLTVSAPFTTEPLGIALPADDPLLLNLVQNYLNTIDHTGQLTQLQAKWLADGWWLSELP